MDIGGGLQLRLDLRYPTWLGTDLVYVMVSELRSNPSQLFKNLDSEKDKENYGLTQGRHQLFVMFLIKLRNFFRI